MAEDFFNAGEAPVSLGAPQEAAYKPVPRRTQFVSPETLAAARKVMSRFNMEPKQALEREDEPGQPTGS